MGIGNRQSGIGNRQQAIRNQKSRRFSCPVLQFIARLRCRAVCATRLLRAAARQRCRARVIAQPTRPAESLPSRLDSALFRPVARLSTSNDRNATRANRSVSDDCTGNRGAFADGEGPGGVKIVTTNPGGKNGAPCGSFVPAHEATIKSDAAFPILAPGPRARKTHTSQKKGTSRRA